MPVYSDQACTLEQQPALAATDDDRVVESFLQSFNVAFAAAPTYSGTAATTPETTDDSFTQDHRAEGTLAQSLLWPQSTVNASRDDRQQLISRSFSLSASPESLRIARRTSSPGTNSSASAVRVDWIDEYFFEEILGPARTPLASRYALEIFSEPPSIPIRYPLRPINDDKGSLRSRSQNLPSAIGQIGDTIITIEHPVFDQVELEPDEMPIESDVAGLSVNQDVSSNNGSAVRRTRRSVKDGVECNLSVRCNQCSTEIATARLRGAKDAFSNPYGADVICIACSSRTSTLPSTSAAVIGRSRRRINMAVECFVCKTGIGRGGLRIITRDLNDEENGAMPWINPDFNVTFLCLDCDRDFRPCTTCGNSAKGLPRKYRPKEMFLEGRKTCILPHDVRIGPPIHHRYISFIIPVTTNVQTLSQQQQQGLCNLKPQVYGEPFPDGERPPYTGGTLVDLHHLAEDVATHVKLWTLSSDASTLKNYHGMRSWEFLIKTAATNSSDFHNFVMGRFRDNDAQAAAAGQDIRRFLTIMLHPAPLASSSKKRSFKSFAPVQNRLLPSYGGGWIIGAAAVTSWNFTRRIVDSFASYPGLANFATNSVLSTIVSIWRLRILQDLENAEIPRPLYITCSFLKAEEGREAKERGRFLMAQAGLIEASDFVKRPGVHIPQERAIEYCDSGWRLTIESQDFYIRDLTFDSLPKLDTHCV